MAATLGDLILRGIGDRSAFALKTALEASTVDGITGVMAIKIPPRAAGKVDLMFTCGPVDVSTRWGEALS